MQSDCSANNLLLEKVLYVTHKGKGRGHQGKLHAHGLKFCEFIYVDYGKINVLLNNKEVIVNSGECLLIQGGSTHSLTGVEGAPFDYLNIAFRSKLPPEIFGKNIAIGRKGLELLENMKQESLQMMSYSNDIIFCLMTEFIIYLLRQLEFSLQDKFTDPPALKTYHSSIVNKALKIIESEYSKPLNLKQISKAVGLSGNYLCSLIKKETGKNFSDILHHQRITVAKHLLRESVFSIEEISTAVGYSSLSFFFKVFKRLSGMTPKAYAMSLGDPTLKE